MTLTSQSAAALDLGNAPLMRSTSPAALLTSPQNLTNGSINGYMITAACPSLSPPRREPTQQHLEGGAPKAAAEGYVATADDRYPSSICTLSKVFGSSVMFLNTSYSFSMKP